MSDSESLVSVEERSATSERSVHAKMIKLTQDLIPASMRSQQYRVRTDGEDGGIAQDTDYHPPPLDSPTSSSKASDPSSSSSMHSSHRHQQHHHNHNHHREQQQQQQIESSNNIVDPREGLELLPVYLKGGVNTVGLGELLGNALALLYVARQGRMIVVVG